MPLRVAVPVELDAIASALLLEIAQEQSLDELLKKLVARVLERPAVGALVARDQGVAELHRLLGDALQVLAETEAILAEVERSGATINRSCSTSSASRGRPNRSITMASKTPFSSSISSRVGSRAGASRDGSGASGRILVELYELP